jgi:uncharacterized protein
MARIEPEEENFDPETFSPADAAHAFKEGVRLFNAAEYHAAHEEIEKCWLATQGPDSDFYKGLIQAAICLHHFRRDNHEGARKLYSGHRKLLGPYLPEHHGIDLAAFLAEMQRVLGPVMRKQEVLFEHATRPVLAVE